MVHKKIFFGKTFFSIKHTAKVSPIAKVAVVLAVGALPKGQASLSTEISEQLHLLFARVEFILPVIPIIGHPNLFN